MGQRVLVTGASGYIGQHLVDSLCKNGGTVRGFARGGKPPTLPAIEWQSGDIRNLAAVEQAVQDCEAVIHLACLPLGPSFENPLRDFSVNALGTLNVLQAVRIADVSQVVYTSTAQVYGLVERLPIAEDSPPQPTSPYAASKLCGETLCTTYARCYGVSTVILRLFNVYGWSLDGRDRPTVESIFVRRIVQGLPPIVKGPPGEGRDFIHLNDVGQAIRLALASREGSGQVINIGSGVLTTLFELAKIAIGVAGSELSPLVEQTDGRPLRLQADTRRARQVLGFEPKVSLSKGLSQMLVEFNRVAQQ